MRRRKFSREFKVEAVKLVKDRGVSVAQAARDLDVHEHVMRKWVKEFGSDRAEAFPCHGQMKPEQQEIERLRRENNRLRAERDILESSFSLRSNGMSGRWHGYAMRRACSVRASMPGRTDPPATDPGVRKQQAGW